jgi:hypothetical protein
MIPVTEYAAIAEATEVKGDNEAIALETIEVASHGKYSQLDYALLESGTGYKVFKKLATNEIIIGVSSSPAQVSKLTQLVSDYKKLSSRVSITGYKKGAKVAATIAAKRNILGVTFGKEPTPLDTISQIIGKVAGYNYKNAINFTECGVSQSDCGEDSGVIFNVTTDQRSLARVWDYKLGAYLIIDDRMYQDTLTSTQRNIFITEKRPRTGKPGELLTSAKAKIAATTAKYVAFRTFLATFKKSLLFFRFMSAHEKYQMFIDYVDAGIEVYYTVEEQAMNVGQILTEHARTALLEQLQTRVQDLDLNMADFEGLQSFLYSGSALEAQEAAARSAELAQQAAADAAAEVKSAFEAVEIAKENVQRAEKAGITASELRAEQDAREAVEAAKSAKIYAEEADKASREAHTYAKTAERKHWTREFTETGREMEEHKGEVEAGVQTAWQKQIEESKEATQRPSLPRQKRTAPDEHQAQEAIKKTRGEPGREAPFSMDIDEYDVLDPSEAQDVHMEEISRTKEIRKLSEGEQELLDKLQNPELSEADAANIVNTMTEKSVRQMSQNRQVAMIDDPRTGAENEFLDKFEEMDLDVQMEMYKHVEESQAGEQSEFLEKMKEIIRGQAQEEPRAPPPPPPPLPTPPPPPKQDISKKVKSGRIKRVETARQKEYTSESRHPLSKPFKSKTKAPKAIEMKEMRILDVDEEAELRDLMTEYEKKIIREFKNDFKLKSVKTLQQEILDDERLGEEAQETLIHQLKIEAEKSRQVSYEIKYGERPDLADVGVEMPIIENISEVPRVYYDYMEEISLHESRWWTEESIEMIHKLKQDINKDARMTTSQVKELFERADGAVDYLRDRLNLDEDLETWIDRTLDLPPSQAVAEFDARVKRLHRNTTMSEEDKTRNIKKITEWRKKITRQPRPKMTKVPRPIEGKTQADAYSEYLNDLLESKEYTESQLNVIRDDIAGHPELSDLDTEILLKRVNLMEEELGNIDVMEHLGSKLQQFANSLGDMEATITRGIQSRFGWVAEFVGTFGEVLGLAGAAAAVGAGIYTERQAAKHREEIQEAITVKRSHYSQEFHYYLNMLGVQVDKPSGYATSESDYYGPHVLKYLKWKTENMDILGDVKATVEGIGKVYRELISPGPLWPDGRVDSAYGTEWNVKREYDRRQRERGTIRKMEAWSIDQYIKEWQWLIEDNVKQHGHTIQETIEKLISKHEVTPFKKLTDDQKTRLLTQEELSLYTNVDSPEQIVIAKQAAIAKDIINKTQQIANRQRHERNFMTAAHRLYDDYVRIMSVDLSDEDNRKRAVNFLKRNMDAFIEGVTALVHDDVMYNAFATNGANMNSYQVYVSAGTMHKQKRWHTTLSGDAEKKQKMEEWLDDPRYSMKAYTKAGHPKKGDMETEGEFADRYMRWVHDTATEWEWRTHKAVIPPPDTTTTGPGTEELPGEFKQPDPKQQPVTKCVPERKRPRCQSVAASKRQKTDTSEWGEKEWKEHLSKFRF